MYYLALHKRSVGTPSPGWWQPPPLKATLLLPHVTFSIVSVGMSSWNHGRADRASVPAQAAGKHVQPKEDLPDTSRLAAWAVLKLFPISHSMKTQLKAHLFPKSQHQLLFTHQSCSRPAAKLQRRGTNLALARSPDTHGPQLHIRHDDLTFHLLPPMGKTRWN